VSDRFDAIVIGGGPGGASAATFLAKGGRRVALFEREVFPRFHVGESLMPATMLLLEQLGVRDAVEAHGFQAKYGATFVDEEHDLQQTYYFLPGQPWGNYAYQVPRAQFDGLLLDNARRHGVTVFQPAAVDAAVFEADGVTVTATGVDGPLVTRAAVLVDASGRDSFLASRLGTRRRVPNLGKVALFAHFRGARRHEGKEEGNIRIHVVRDGWFWWIPLANDLTSVGAVLHARTVQAWRGSMDDLFEDMIRRSRVVSAGLAGAERTTPVYRQANFAYENSPVVGDRFLAVGDAITFLDPIFSGGVFIAIRSGQLAAETILAAFRDGRFTRRRFAGYERRIKRDLAPLFRFIHRYYEPAFLDLLLHPRDYFGIYRAVLTVLSGGSFIRMPWRVRAALAILFGIARVNVWLRRRTGRPHESRLEW
jgi:flavin-dependent dehydrogenase